MQNAPHYDQFPFANVQSSIFATTIHSAKKRQSRAKRHIAWERAVELSDGRYDASLREIARLYPFLSPMELRVATLVRAMLPSWRIGELLSIAEVSVERIRCRIRRKIGLNKENLQCHLSSI